MGSVKVTLKVYQQEGYFLHTMTNTQVKQASIAFDKTIVTLSMHKMYDPDHRTS